MTDNTSQDSTPQGNIKLEYNVASTGLNLDNTVNQVSKGQLTYALNASVENFDSSSVNYQNEPGNEACITFPNEFVLIGAHFIQEKNKHIFFITNPITEESEIGFMENNDCQYQTLVNASCLNFNINYPIHKVVHKITNCTTEIYWTDGFNPRRYLDIENIPWKLKVTSNLCDPTPDIGNLDCNQLKLQPNFNIPELSIVDIRNGGDLTSGTYQFAIQYSDASGNPYTSYYSVTNPCPIADIRTTTPNFNYQVGKSIVISIDNLDETGLFQYFNLAVIKTINDIPSVELVGTYFIDQSIKNITYTGQNQTQIRLTIQDIFEKFPYYELANDLTAVQDVLVWNGLTSIDRINYQSIATQITLQWQTYKIPATENYADELNATNLRGYLRDEVYAFEIVFLLRNGKQTDGFHIPGRLKNVNEAYPDVPNTNSDFIGNGTSAPYWKIYNTASVTGTALGDPIGNATPYQYGEFAYWESEDVYPCNIDLWGDLADQPIRHHKFPDVLVSPIFESVIFGGASSMVMQNDAVFPIGVKIDIDQVRNLIITSSLTKSQKDDIIGFKIVRGNRGTNKSIIAKGILRNVNSYKREEQEFYFPNYPYNDLDVDPFLNQNNNAWLQTAEPWLIIGEALENGKIIIQYTDCNTGKLTTRDDIVAGQTIEICAITRPITLQGKALIGPGNYDVWYSNACGGCRGYRFSWADPFTDNNLALVDNDPYLEGCGIFPGCFFGCDEEWARVDVGGIARTDCNNSFWDGFCKCDASTLDAAQVGYTTQPINVIDLNGGTIKHPRIGRRSSLKTKEQVPLPALSLSQDTNYRYVFNSPETSFGQPFLGTILKLENVIYGAGKGHFVQVKNNAKYKLLSEEAQRDAYASSDKIANLGSYNATALFTAYQTYLQIYINGITRKNYAYSFNSIANYDYWASINNNLGIKQREIDYTQYLIPGVQSVGDPNGIVMNNFQRESSVFIKTIEDRNGIPVTAIPFPSNSPEMLDGGGVPIVTDKSRFTISSINHCATPAKEKQLTVVSYYASMKNDFVNQWGQIYSYDTVDTGFQKNITDNNSSTIFGGDTFISRFAFKTKIPFFFDNRVNAPDDSDVFYDEIGNVAYPKYWHSARSILKNIGDLTNFISYKAHEFDCPNDPSKIAPATTTGAYGSYRTFYDGYFYLFAYGVPNFYCESSYNTDLRQAFNNKEGDFWPHVTTGIPDDWVQETYVSIANDNTYTYNVTFSKQNKENFFSHLPSDWTDQLCFTYFPFRAIYSDTQNQNADVRVNNWLIYRATSLFDFPQNYGSLTALDGIQNRAILARFENKTLMYNNLLTINTSNPQAAYVGNPNMFSAPPVDFAETDLGYVGSQNKMLLKIPQGQITVDAKRGQIFLIEGTQAVDLSGFGSGMNRFFTDHLAFEILRYFPNVSTDNHFNGIGLHGVYDSKFERIILTKLDYIPIDKDIKYDAITKQFYLETIIDGNSVIRSEVYLTDSDYFCNKSWTISFNFNTKSWISFHSYIPNWYIGENNFFYSGVNGCCTDIAGDFTAIVGTLNKIPPTTTTTSSTTSISTTMAPRLKKDCDLEGVIVETLCELEGDAVITVPPSTTTTVCVRPSDLSRITFLSGYQIEPDPIVDSTISFEAACGAFGILTSSSTAIPEGFNVGYSTLEIGSVLYYDYNNNDCTYVPDGWYITQEGLYNGFVYYVEGGTLTSKDYCDCGSTTPDTTVIPNIQECCGILFSTIDGVYYSDTITTDMALLNIPNFSSTYGIAMTANYLWSVTTEFLMWDITLSPFSATFNTAIPFPGAFTTSSGIVALNDTTLITIGDYSSPQDVVELVLDCNVTPPAFISTVQFSLQADRIALSNMLYTTTEKLIVINQDTITSDYYLTQYEYPSGIIELDLNIGSIVPTSIYECACIIYITTSLDVLYTIEKSSPNSLVEVTTLTSNAFISATQVATCVGGSLIDSVVTTTTTTTIAITTTSTTTV
jgi:hypothetical protein